LPTVLHLDSMFDKAVRLDMRAFNNDSANFGEKFVWRMLVQRLGRQDHRFSKF
jgi:hypothetical protein